MGNRVLARGGGGNYKGDSLRGVWGVMELF